MKRLLPLALLLIGCAAADEDMEYVGSTAPDFKVETLSVPISDASLAKRRGKVVLIDYWATWCGPCKMLSPQLEAIYERYKGRGLEAMAITDEAREIVAIVEKKQPHKLPVYIDTKSEANAKLGIKALPTVLLIDKAGHIAYRFSGVPDSPDDLVAAVEKALAE